MKDVSASSREEERPRVVVLVFSKDRPLQIDAFLESLYLCGQNVQPSGIHVLCKASGKDYKSGYEMVATQHPGVTFTLERDFKSDLLDAISAYEFVLFAVDDTLWVGDFDLSDGTAALDHHADLIGFTYRLGRNTTYCYPLDRPMPLPAFERIDDGLLAYRWPGAGDFDYPLEVSSSLYRSADLAELLRALPYRNPNSLEHELAKRSRDFIEVHPRLACYEQSVAFSVPANLVQSVSKNRSAGRADLTSEALLQRYLDGYRLNVAYYRGLVADSPHMEVDFAYRKVEMPSRDETKRAILTHGGAGEPRSVLDRLGRIVRL